MPRALGGSTYQRWQSVWVRMRIWECLRDHWTCLNSKSCYDFRTCAVQAIESYAMLEYSAPLTAAWFLSHAFLKRESNEYRTPRSLPHLQILRESIQWFYESISIFTPPYPTGLTVCGKPSDLEHNPVKNVCIYVWMHACMHVYIYIIYIYIHMCVCVCVCMCICVYVYAHVYV